MPDHYLLFITSALIASAIPGLAVMGAFTTSLKYGFKTATIFSLGLISATILYFILSGLGLMVLVRDYVFLFTVVKYCGIAYLFYLGLMSFLSSKNTLDLEQKTALEGVIYRDMPDEKMMSKNWGFYFAGVMLHLGNPKNILFFVAVLPQYININKSMGEQIFWLTIGSEIPEFLLLLLYAYFAIKIKPFLCRPKVFHIFNKVVGLLFMGLAGTLIML